MTSDPTNQPIIQPNYGSHRADVTVLSVALRWADKLSHSKHVAGSLAERKLPPPEWDLQDLSNGEKAVEENIFGEYHACGSVALGDALDSRLKVKGVANVRVADASVFPNNVSGNIQSSVYAVAEKAADLIKEDRANGA